MPKISHRGEIMPASPIRKLVPFADAAKKRGLKVYHLNIGQPDIMTPSIFLDAVRKVDLETIEYSPSQGLPGLRKRFAKYYQDNGIPVTADNLIVTTGGSEALYFAFMSCLDPGDEIIVPEPFYANYNGFAVGSGAKVVPITTRIEDNFDLPEISEFEQLVTPKTKAILICNPSNPTGKLYSKDALMKLREVVLKHDLYLIVDEVYREFVYEGEKHFSSLNLEGLAQHVVVVDSISKRYSACGARIGTIVSFNADVMNAALKFAQARLSPPTLEQIGAEAVMDVDSSYFKEVNQEYAARYATAYQALKSIPGVVVPKVSGAFYMIVKLPIDDSDNFCQWLLEHFEFEGATVMLAPASGFYATEGLGKDEVRIAYVLNQDDLTHAIQCLAAALKVYPGVRTTEKATAEPR
jgi:aspartate aminotransferase